MKKFGDWIMWGIIKRPDGLKDDQRIEVVFIDRNGDLFSGVERTTGNHAWSEVVTLAYRVEITEITTILYGSPALSVWSAGIEIGDTHEIKLVTTGDGEVVSCSARKL